MRLKNILSGLKTEKTVGDENIDIIGITANSNEVKKGFMFIAIKGNKADGHHYINAAIENGAASIVLEKMNISGHTPCTIVELKDSREALPVIASNFYKSPSSKMKLVGITGTNGKTTISYLLEAIWMESDINSGVIGTVENRYMNKVFESNLTTPDPVKLTKMLSDMQKGGVENVAIEVSSHALDLKRVDGCDFDAAIFTNLTQDHLDYHGSLEDYFFAKKRLFTEVLVKSNKKEKYSIINIDDTFGQELFDEISGQKISYSIKNRESDIYPEKFELSSKGISATIKTPRGRFILKSKLVGEHNLYNLMAAAGTAILTGSTIESVEKAFNNISQIPGRLESIKNELGINVLVDYAHTPDALKNVLGSLRPITIKDIITVVGCGGDRDKKKRPIMGKIGAELSDQLIITSDNPRTENAELIIEDIVKGIDKKLTEKTKTITDREKAISYAIDKANPGDTVLIAGKGHEDYQIVGEEKFHFDDREVARKYIREKELN